MAALKSNSTGRKTNMFSHIRYEHMVAGFSGGVTSTLILHPLDLIKIRFAGKYNISLLIAGPARPALITLHSSIIFINVSLCLVSGHYSE